MVAARLNFLDVMYRRKVLHLIDNTVALSKSVHGYANEPDMAAVVNSLHVCDAAFGVEAWFEWVPSLRGPVAHARKRARARRWRGCRPAAVTFSSLRLDRWTSVMHDGQPPHSNASPLRLGVRLHHG